MKLICSLFVLVSLGILTPNLYADPVLTITDSVGAIVAVESPVAGGEQWVYTDDTTTILGVGLAQIDTDTLTATFTDIAGIALLNVTDICANAGVLAPANPCVGFAFSDTALGIPDVLSAAGNLALAADVNVGALGVDLAGVSIGQGSEEIGFENPPPTSVAPEPNALSLFGTGLIGVAGVMKKKFCA